MFYCIRWFLTEKANLLSYRNQKHGHFQKLQTSSFAGTAESYINPYIVKCKVFSLYVCVSSSAYLYIHHKFIVYSSVTLLWHERCKIYSYDTKSLCNRLNGTQIIVTCNNINNTLQRLKVCITLNFKLWEVKCNTRNNL